MSEVNASDTRPIGGIQDVIQTYEGAGKEAKTGVEVELAFFDPNTPDLTPMTIPQNKVLKNAANAAKGEEFVRNEPTSEMLEVGSFARDEHNLRAIMDDTQSKIELLTQKAADIGLKRSYFQHLPDQSAKQLLQNVMDVERYQAFFGPPRKDMEEIAAYFSVCKSNQISVSYRDHDHMLSNVRRLYTLAPFIYMITDNAAPFNEGKAFDGNAAMHHRAALGGRGGVPPYVFTANSGAEYIESHIDHVMNNPLFVYYNEKGELQRLPSGTWTSFNTLREQGLNTATNYYFAESILWPDVKIAALKNAQGEVNGHRFEARMIGVGLHQHQTALLLVAALAFDDAFAHGVDILLDEFGLNQRKPKALREPLTAAYKAARHHNQKFLDIPYGTGSMAEFAKKFADLLQDAALISEFEEEIAPLLLICRTGCTDSKVNALLFNTLEKAKDFQKHYNDDIFKDPTGCAHTVLENELKNHPDRAGCCGTR